MTDTTTDKGLDEEIGSGWTAYHETTDRMQALCEKHGCSPGSNRFDWLDEQLSRRSRITAPVEGMGLETTEIERSEMREIVDENPNEVSNRSIGRLLADLETLSARLRVAEEALGVFRGQPRIEQDEGSTSLRWVAPSDDWAFSLVFTGDERITGVVSTRNPARSDCWGIDAASIRARGES